MSPPTWAFLWGKLCPTPSSSPRTASVTSGAEGNPNEETDALPSGFSLFFQHLSFSFFFIFPESFCVCAIWAQENWSHSCHRMDELKQNYNFCSRTCEWRQAESWGGEGDSEAPRAGESWLSTHLFCGRQRRPRNVLIC